MFFDRLLFWFALPSAVYGISTPSPGSERCNELWTSLSIENATLLAVGYYPQNAQIELVGIVPSCAVNANNTVTTPVAICRVVYSYATSSTSDVLVEGWLPDEWNARLMATGGGGIGGCVDYATVEYGTAFGFATFGTNGGHNGSAGFELFLKKPETIIVFGQRAIHIEAVLSKIIVENIIRLLLITIIMLDAVQVVGRDFRRLFDILMISMEFWQALLESPG
jgi:hypothetical protein